MEFSADRGSIYEFIESDGTVKNRVLVVSDQSRSRENIISALRLSPAKEGRDTIMVDYDSKTGCYWYVHCGCVSYVYRNRLGRKTGEVLETTMKEIDVLMREQLGLTEDKVTYKELYENLLNKVMSKEDKEWN